MDRPKLTDAQRKALNHLSINDRTAPADLGAAICGGLKKSGHPMKAQGLGRLGGTMGWRLAKMGLANRSSRSGGFPAFSITAAGRAALEDK